MSLSSTCVYLHLQQDDVLMNQDLFTILCRFVHRQDTFHYMLVFHFLFFKNVFLNKSEYIKEQEHLISQPIQPSDGIHLLCLLQAINAPAS